MDFKGEPLARGQLDRRTAEGLALRDAAFAIALFTVVVLVNGILAILLVALSQAIGWWEAFASETAHDTASVLSGRLRVEAAFAACRQ